MEKIKSKKMFGNINTNGVLLTESDINKIIKMKWDMIMFSIDGHNAEIHDFIRQTPGTFDQVLKNMLLLNESKTNKYEPKVIFNTVIHSKNFNHLDKILELGEQVGTSDITFIPLAVLGPMQDRLELSNDEKQVLQQLLPKYIQLAKKLGIDTNLESLQEGTPNSSPKTGGSFRCATLPLRRE